MPRASAQVLLCYARQSASAYAQRACHGARSIARQRCAACAVTYAMRGGYECYVVERAARRLLYARQPARCGATSSNHIWWGLFSFLFFVIFFFHAAAAAIITIIFFDLRCHAYPFHYYFIITPFHYFLSPFLRHFAFIIFFLFIFATFHYIDDAITLSIILTYFHWYWISH